MQPVNGVRATQLSNVMWRKSDFSNPNGECVELATLHGRDAAVRNSTDPEGPALVFTRGALAAFLLGAKSGEFDDLVALDPGVG